jgi:hypothetical protein
MLYKEFVPYEPSLDMKELGFDEPCFAFYNGKFIQSTEFDFDSYNSINVGPHPLAPTFSQAFRWFRDKYNLFGCIDLHVCSPSHWFIRIDKIDINDYLYHSEDENIQYNTYEEAELACLIKLIEIVKEKK